MAHRLGAKGVSLVLVARRADRLEAIAQQYRNVEVLIADLETPEGVARVVARIGDVTRAPIDLVVNNAGFGTSGAVNHMLPRGRGFVLNVSSVASFQANPGLAVYSATKAFVTSLTEALHEEVRGTGVRVSALCPGLTKTEFQSISNTTGFESQFPSFAWTSVDSVAKAGLRGVAKGKAVIVPGLLYKVLAAISQVTPRRAQRRLVRVLTRR
jgi:short-subunit dehydrogenase